MATDWMEELLGPYTQLALRNALPARLVLRPQGDHNGWPLTMVVGVVHGDPRSDTTKAASPAGDELVFCKLVIGEAHQRWAGAPRGLDANGLLVRGGLWPAYWDRQVEGPLWKPPTE